MDDIGTKVTSYERVNDGVWLDENGDFKVTFKVPSLLDDGKIKMEVERGTYYVYVCHYTGTTITTRILAVADFKVINGEISLSPQKGTVGTPVEISGIDFPSRADLTFKYDGIAVPIDSGQKQTGSAGRFVTTIRIPESTAGSHKISAIAAGTEVSSTFTVKPEITVTPTSGEVNRVITVSGTGFGSKTQVTLWFNNIQMATTMTSVAGSFSRGFNIPDLGAGVYTVEAEGEANLAKAKFTLIVPTPLPTPTPAPAPVPTPAPVPSLAISASATSVYVSQGIVISGTGFRNGGIITIKYDDKLVAATTADGNGLFAASFTVPGSKYGAHTVSASDGTNAKEIVFTVESTPPPIPTLLLPENEGKVKVPVTLYWSPVTDDSQPVSYTLQVATSKDFSTTSMLVAKEGIKDIEYSITSQEQREFLKTGVPYYWRVQATDGALNEGQWTRTEVFYIAGGFPGWALYTIIALGAFFLFGLGYLISMKTRIRKEE